MSNPSTTAAGLVLTHGSGGDHTHPTFVALEERLDLPIHRFDFPYRKRAKEAGKTRGFPDRAPKLIDSVTEESKRFASQLDVGTERLVLGGRSMGGRMCSMAVAEGLAAKALLLLSYPLHPPEKPDKLRIEHFGDIDVPVLFISGTRDPFGTPEEISDHAAAIAGSVTLHFLDGATHDPKKHDDEILQVTQEWLATVG